MSLPLQVLVLTGQSDPRSCALSPVQQAFLDALDLPGRGLPAAAAVGLNFPYDTARCPRPHREVPLWLASLRHVALFFAIRRRRWALRHRPGVQAVLERADRSLVIAGSIGLDLLGRLDLPAAVLDRTVVLALGPVATRPPACRTVRVVGRGDHVARWWAADVTIDAAHMEYLASPDVLALASGLVDELLDDGAAA